MRSRLAFLALRALRAAPSSLATLTRFVASRQPRSFFPYAHTLTLFSLFVSVSPSLYTCRCRGLVVGGFCASRCFLTISRLRPHRFRPPTPAPAAPAWPQTWTRPTSGFRCVHVSLGLSFLFPTFADAGSQASADPAAWKGRSKDESEYSKSMQKGKEGAYSAESGWVSGQSAADRAARFVCSPSRMNIESHLLCAVVKLLISVCLALWVTLIN